MPCPRARRGIRAGQAPPHDESVVQGGTRPRPYDQDDIQGISKPRPYQVLHDTKKQASLSHRIDGKQSDRTEVTSGEPVKPSSRLRLVRFAHARKPGGASPAPTTRTVFRGMSKPRPYDAEHDV